MTLKDSQLHSSMSA